MKGAQTGGTVGVMENALGYFIGHIKTAPMMMITATQQLADIRVDEYIMPMIQQSGLAHLIQSNDETSNRKSGRTARKISGFGGWFFMPLGAREAANLRSVSMRVLMRDEMDGWPINVGKDGDPVALSARRVNAFIESCKILDISTPLLEHESRIKIEFELGDQRYYMMPCLGCSHPQPYRFEVKDDRTGEKKGGLFWEMDGDRIKPDSVRYVCPECGYDHMNEHKAKMFKHAEWEPTATPEHPHRRSYHISGLMSPAGFFSWEHAVRDWLKAWDVEAKAPKDHEKMQEFYNGVLGMPWAVGTLKLTYAKVAKHCRDYTPGTVPHDHVKQMCGDPRPMSLTCAVDVQDKFLSVAVYAWGRHRVGFLVEYVTFHGSTSDIDAPDSPWRDLLKMLREKKYSDGNGRDYTISFTVIDSGHNPKVAYAFCQAIGGSMVCPIKGASSRVTGAATEFTKMKNASQIGTEGWNINVDMYKSRISQLLLGPACDGTHLAPVESVSFPLEIPDAALKELTGEELIEETNKHGHKSWVWKRKATRNELWDLTVYNSAARDILAYRLCRESLEQETVQWDLFWNLIEKGKIGWSDVAPVAPPEPDKV
jgi:phage terminase large subunit GpA-like protein